MTWSPRARTKDYFAERTLEIYLMPRAPWETILAFQQRLVFDLTETPRDRAALILCEHPSIVTVGRQGSYRQIRMEAAPIATGHVRVRWCNRGGAGWHQQPGQLAAYPVVPLCSERFGLADYRGALYQTILEVLEDFRISAQWDPAAMGVHVGDRQIASVGVAVKDWVSYHGCVLNVAIPLDQQPLVESGNGSGAWTCMFRELRTPVRLDAVRESFLRHFCKLLGFGHYYLSKPPAGVLNQTRSADVRVANY